MHKMRSPATGQSPGPPDFPSLGALEREGQGSVAFPSPHAAWGLGAPVYAEIRS